MSRASNKNEADGFLARQRLAGGLSWTINQVLRHGCVEHQLPGGRVERVTLLPSARFLNIAVRFLAEQERRSSPEWAARNVLGRTGRSILNAAKADIRLGEVDGSWTAAVVRREGGELVAEAVAPTRPLAVDAVLSKVLVKLFRRGGMRPTAARSKNGGKRK